MSNATRDLWGDLSTEPFDEAESPAFKLMREQADLLRKKTDGKLEGHLVLSLDRNNHAFQARFFIVAPALDYRYELFHVRQRQLEYFPVELYRGGEKVATCANLQEFEETLSLALRSKATRTVLDQLRHVVDENRDSA